MSRWRSSEDPATTLLSTLVNGQAQFTVGPLPPGVYSVRASTVGADSIESTLSALLGVAPLAFITTALPPNMLRESYSGLIETSGGFGTRSVTVTAGILPDGVTLSPSGFLTGVAREAGDFPIVVTVTDSIGTTPVSRSLVSRIFAVDQFASPVAGPMLLPFGAGSGSPVIGQVFTNNAAGQLNAVRLAMSCQSGPGANATATAEIHEVDNAGVIQAAVLAAGSVSVQTGPHIPGVRYLVSLAQPVPVGPGLRLAAVLGANGQCSIEPSSYDFGDAYRTPGPGGRRWRTSPSTPW